VGAVEVMLADPRASVDFICDGIHVHPAAIRAALAAKGTDGVMAITDSNIGAGLPAGRYDSPWGYAVEVSPERAARIAPPHPRAGQLAGSSLTMNVAMGNLRRWLGEVPEHDQWAMGTRTPARVAGLANRGILRAGAAANLVLWNDDLSAAQTWVGGQEAFNASKQSF
jgi:N-acetylglucosamine-6-phosphate deacetylase